MIDIWNYFLFKRSIPTPTNCPLTYDVPAFAPAVNVAATLAFPAAQRITCPSLESIYGQINGLYMITIASLDGTINIGVLMATEKTISSYRTRVIFPLPFSNVVNKFVNNNVAYFWAGNSIDKYLLPNSTLIVEVTTVLQPGCEIKFALLATW